MHDFFSKFKKFLKKGHVSWCLKSLYANIYNIYLCFVLIGVLLILILLEVLCLSLGIIIDIIAFLFILYEKCLKKINVSKCL